MRRFLLQEHVGVVCDVLQSMNDKLSKGNGVWAAGVPGHHAKHIVNISHEAEEACRIRDVVETKVVADGCMELMFVISRRQGCLESPWGLPRSGGEWC